MNGVSSFPTSTPSLLQAGSSLREPREQLLRADAVEADGDLEVVRVLLDREDHADAELRVLDAHTRP